MRFDQKHTPKYWVGNSKHSNDIIIGTMRKNYSDAEKALINLVGEDYSDFDFEIKLIEIKLVDL